LGASARTWFAATFCALAAGTLAAGTLAAGALAVCGGRVRAFLADCQSVRRRNRALRFRQMKAKRWIRLAVTPAKARAPKIATSSLCNEVFGGAASDRRPASGVTADMPRFALVSPTASLASATGESAAGGGAEYESSGCGAPSLVTGLAADWALDASVLSPSRRLLAGNSARASAFGRGGMAARGAMAIGFAAVVIAIAGAGCDARCSALSRRYQQ
jgi:hypothetical protein